MNVIHRIDTANRYRLNCQGCKAPLPIIRVNISHVIGESVRLCHTCALETLSRLAAALEIDAGITDEEKQHAEDWRLAEERWNAPPPSPIPWPKR